MENIFIAIFVIAGMFALIIPISLWFAFTASILWGWFVVPAFGIVPLTTMQCWGIALTLSMFNPRLRTTKSDPSEFGSALGACLLAPCLVLGLGWAIKNWWM